MLYEFSSLRELAQFFQGQAIEARRRAEQASGPALGGLKRSLYAAEATWTAAADIVAHAKIVPFPPEPLDKGRNTL